MKAEREREKDSFASSESEEGEKRPFVLKDANRWMRVTSRGVFSSSSRWVQAGRAGEGVSLCFCVLVLFGILGGLFSHLVHSSPFLRERGLVCRPVLYKAPQVEKRDPLRVYTPGSCSVYVVGTYL